MDEGHLVTLLETVIRQSAGRLSVERPHGKGVGQLLTTVRQEDPETYLLLDAFVAAYFDWYGYRKRAMESMRGATPFVPDSGELAELMRRRDDAREALLRRVAEAG